VKLAPNNGMQQTARSAAADTERSMIIIRMCSIHDSNLSRVPTVHIKKEQSIHESEDYYKERDRCRC
jgi:hypothetical protein